MNVELIELRDDRVRFLLSGVTPAFANAIRRSCIAEVPKLAIDEISIYENTSVLFDEQIALRLGLIPIRAEDLSVYSTPDECQCGGVGCPGCRIDFMITAEGPGTVYSRDIKFSDPAVRAAFDNIPLVVLGDGEKLVIEGFATLRTGKEHAKWQAGTLCGYKNLPSIEISGCNGCGRCVKVCPRGVLALDENDTLKVNDITECSLCRLCVEECEQRAISVVPLEDAFIMSIESDGSINAGDLVRMAAEELKKKALLLQDTLASLS